MDIDETIITECDNEFCEMLGVCIGPASTEELIEALGNLLGDTYAKGWQDGVESSKLAQESVVNPEDTGVGFSREIYQLAEAVDESLSAVGEDFARIQDWADFVNENLDNLYGDLESLAEDQDADAVFLEAIAIRLSELEQENKNLWQAVLSK